MTSKQRSPIVCDDAVGLIATGIKQQGKQVPSASTLLGPSVPSGVLAIPGYPRPRNICISYPHVRKVSCTIVKRTIEGAYLSGSICVVNELLRCSILLSR